MPATKIATGYSAWRGKHRGGFPLGTATARKCVIRIGDRAIEGSASSGEGGEKKEDRISGALEL